MSNNFGCIGRSNSWGDLDQMWRVGRHGGRNHVCNIWWLSVKGCGCGERGNFALSPYNTGHTTAWPCDIVSYCGISVWFWSLFELKFDSSNIVSFHYFQARQLAAVTIYQHAGPVRRFYQFLLGSVRWIVRSPQLKVVYRRRRATRQRRNYWRHRRTDSLTTTIIIIIIIIISPSNSNSTFQWRQHTYPRRHHCLLRQSLRMTARCLSSSTRPRGKTANRLTSGGTWCRSPRQTTRSFTTRCLRRTMRYHQYWTCLILRMITYIQYIHTCHTFSKQQRADRPLTRRNRTIKQIVETTTPLLF